jgi:hypothetical protein
LAQGWDYLEAKKLKSAFGGIKPGSPIRFLNPHLCSSLHHLPGFAGKGFRPVQRIGVCLPLFEVTIVEPRKKGDFLNKSKSFVERKDLNGYGQ